MGPNASKIYEEEDEVKIRKNYFEFRHVIGKGGFGKVWKVIFKKTQKVYALKEMSKVKIIDKKSEMSIKMERQILSQLHHPFIVNMIYAFQDYDNLYLVMDYLSGGDIRFHICKQDLFTEEQSKFFVACLLVGLEYIHKNKIIHRDLKPENLVCDKNGYLRITDFGVAKRAKLNNANETSGTPGYMAPEVLCSQNHSYPVDFYAIGVMVYEFMMGERPYLGRSRKEIKDAVLQKQVKLNSDNLPKGWSNFSADFVNKLLKRKQEKRLGYINGVADLKSHPWFDNYDWDGIKNKTMKSPFVPESTNNFDKSYCEGFDPISPDTLERYQSYVQNDRYSNEFKDYTYYDENEMSKVISINKNSLNGNVLLSSENRKIKKNNSLILRTRNKNDYSHTLFSQANNKKKPLLSNLKFPSQYKIKKITLNKKLKFHESSSMLNLKSAQYDVASKKTHQNACLIKSQSMSLLPVSSGNMSTKTNSKIKIIKKGNVKMFNGVGNNAMQLPALHNLKEEKIKIHLKSILKKKTNLPFSISPYHKVSCN